MLKKGTLLLAMIAILSVGSACGDKAHTHAWGSEPSYNDVYHYTVCSDCGEQKDKEKHTGENCTVCAFSYTPTEGILYRLSEDKTYAIAAEHIGEETTLYVASSYEGVPVKAIAENAFFKDEKITKVVIPGSVQTIGASAFDECVNLQQVVIMDGVLKIDDYAFRKCSVLTEVVLPNTLTNIGYGAFYLCEALPSIVIPLSVECILNYAFAYCYSITIYCEVDSRPGVWDLSWNYGFPVVWGYTGE